MRRKAVHCVAAPFGPTVVALVALAVAGRAVRPTVARAQAPAPVAPVAHVTFADAIRRAQENHPTVAAASAAILRAEGLIRQARAASRLHLLGNVTTTTLNTGVEFQGTTVTPQNQVSLSMTADQPILAAAAWARQAQAQDARTIADLSVADVKRQVAFAAADAYLTILAQRRVLDSNARAAEVAKAHFDLATELERRGSGSRLNALRAEQQYSVDQGLVESARLAVYRAQEALGTLIAVDGPADAADEPDFTPPGDAFTLAGGLRTDVRLFAAQQQAAERIVRDSSKDWWPTIDALFQPSAVYPSQFFLPQYSWRFLTQTSIPMFDAGQRASLRLQRQAAVEEARANVAGLAFRVGSQVRSAREAVASSERSVALARSAADQAQQVVAITDVSFRAGAATNIEVIDAERSARDADTAVAIAEDQLRRARLELLNAIGRFP